MALRGVLHAAQETFAVLSDGSVLHLDVSAPAPVGGDLQLDATLSLDSAAMPTTSLLFALDLSGSTLGVGLVDTILDCELAATLDAIEEVGAWGSVARRAAVVHRPARRSRQ